MKSARKTRKTTPNTNPQMGSQPKLQLAAETASETSLDGFLRSASHELANMLGTVLGELDYGLSNPNPTVKARAMSVAVGAAERARSLARNLSYFALHPSTKAESYSVTQVLNDTFELSHAELLHRRVRTQLSIESGVVAFGDSSALQQSLLNIFRRSVSTMPQGGILSAALSRKNGVIELVVRDNGVGIPEQRLQNLLHPEFTDGPADNKTDPNELELFVTRVLSERQGIKFDVRSSPGTGTTYTLQLAMSDRATASSFVELRRYRRVEAALGVEMGFSGAAPFRSEMETLSVGGCFVRVTDPQAKLPAKESVGSLRIFYYQDQILDIHRCRIASIHKADGSAGMGIEFLEVDPKAEKLLRAIVHSHGFQSKP